MIRISIKKELFIVMRRLKKKRYSLEKIIIILGKYRKFKKIQSQRQIREGRRCIGDIVANISDKTGIPQWEIRDKIQRDFGIDI